MASPRRTSNRVPKPSERALAASESPKSSLGKRKKTECGAKNPGPSDSSTKSSSSASRSKASSSASNSKISICSDSDDDPELSHTKTLSDNHSSLGRSTSITLLGDMDNDSSGEFEGEEPDESNDMAQDDEDEGSDDERQTKRVKQDKAAKKADPPKEITVNISLYSQKEMRKPLKKREPTACGLMQMLSDTSYYRFECKLLSKLATLAKVAVVSEEEDVQIEFQVPRHVSNYVQLDDEAAYKVMVAAAIKCKDPKINLAVVRLQENNGKDSDAEDDKKKKKKKDTKKSKIPSENDISAPNAEINAKIGLLRTKYTCHANDGSDYCWVSGEEKRHIPLGHVHFNLWAAAWAKGDADADTPPNHAIFSGKGNVNTRPPWADPLPVSTVIPDKSNAVAVLSEYLADTSYAGAMWYRDGSLMEGLAG
ncbi:hypothetical protein B0H14DRAFT_3717362 [Mycena olivaceomarginata]|nr:hypothetical protein B0H14DRAFT_3717362 [Mycena olivaceomarginata]